MTVRTRGYLNALAGYRAGRTPAQTGVLDAVKLSSNENAYPPLPGVVAEAVAAVERMNRYPDFYPGALLEAIAHRNGVEVNQVNVGCGSSALIFQLLHCVAGPGDEVMLGWRTFDAFVTAITLTGATVARVPLLDERHDLPTMADQINERTRAVIVCSPNNPTSTIVGREELETFVASVPDDVLIILDDAYGEFVTSADAADAVALAAAHDNVAVLRTFSKAYGLAGLRVGYCLSSPELADVLRRVIPPFSVSNVAQAAAVASLREEHAPELAARISAIIAERARVRAELVQMGIAVPESEANFLWLPIGEPAAEVAQGLERAGVIVRAYPPDGLRVTIGLREENDAFLHALQGVLAPTTG